MPFTLFNGGRATRSLPPPHGDKLFIIFQIHTYFLKLIERKHNGHRLRREDQVVDQQECPPLAAPSEPMANAQAGRRNGIESSGHVHSSYKLAPKVEALLKTRSAKARG